MSKHVKPKPQPQPKIDFKDALVYVCAPYRGKDEAAIYTNIEFAIECGRWVLKHGGLPFIPHINTRELFGLVADDKDVVPYDDKMLEKCNALLVCGDRMSAGMKHEMNLFIENKLQPHVVFLSSPYEDNKGNRKS